MYTFDASRAATLTILWYGNSSLLSRAIRFVTRSRFSHVAVMLDDVLYEALGSGIVRRNGNDAYRRKMQALARYELHGSLDDKRRARRFLEFHTKRHVSPSTTLVERIIAPFTSNYSVLGFLAAGVDRLTGWRLVIAVDGEYICSGYAARAAELFGASFEHDPRTMDPEELARAFGVSQ